MITISTLQLRALAAWARLSMNGGEDDTIALHVTTGGNLIAIQGDRHEIWDRTGGPVK